MTNQEKHKDKSPLILQKIFDDFCEKQGECCNCEFYQNTYRYTDCVFQWLMKKIKESESESENEKT